MMKVASNFHSSAVWSVHHSLYRKMFMCKPLTWVKWFWRSYKPIFAIGHLCSPSNSLCHPCPSQWNIHVCHSYHSFQTLQHLSTRGHVIRPNKTAHTDSKEDRNRINITSDLPTPAPQSDLNIDIYCLPSVTHFCKWEKFPNWVK